VYSTYFGGGDPVNGVTLGGGIAVDANANVYITGGTNFQHTGNTATDFPILNAYQGCLDTSPPATPPTNPPSCSTSVTAPDAFVAKINPAASSGAQLIYSSYLGGTGSDVGYGIALDSGLSVYITGSTSSTDFTIPSTYHALSEMPGQSREPFPLSDGSHRQRRLRSQIWNAVHGLNLHHHHFAFYVLFVSGWFRHGRGSGYRSG
jgi:hypothetical protein